MGKIHQCSICGYKSYFSGNFHRHMKNHEKDKKSESTSSGTFSSSGKSSNSNEQSEYESSISKKSMRDATSYQQSETHFQLSDKFLKRSYLSSDSEPEEIVTSEKKKVLKKKKDQHKTFISKLFLKGLIDDILERKNNFEP